MFYVEPPRRGSLLTHMPGEVAMATSFCLKLGQTIHSGAVHDGLTSHLTKIPIGLLELMFYQCYTDYFVPGVG